MRPDRLVVGEVRGAEVTDLLAALNTGHDGGCGTLHANRPAEVPARLEALGVAAGLDRAAVHSQAAAALAVVVHLRRTPAGRRVDEIGVVRRAGDLVAVEPGWRADGRPCPGRARLARAARRLRGPGMVTAPGGGGAWRRCCGRAARRTGARAAAAWPARAAAVRPVSAAGRAAGSRGRCRRRGRRWRDGEHAARRGAGGRVAGLGRRASWSRRRDGDARGAAGSTGSSRGSARLAAELRSGRALDGGDRRRGRRVRRPRTRPGARPGRPRARARPWTGPTPLGEAARRGSRRPCCSAPAPAARWPTWSAPSRTTCAPATGAGWSSGRRPRGRGPARCCSPGCRCWAWRWAAASGADPWGVLTDHRAGQVLLVAGRRARARRPGVVAPAGPPGGCGEPPAPWPLLLRAAALVLLLWPSPRVRGDPRVRALRAPPPRATPRRPSCRRTGSGDGDGLWPGRPAPPSRCCSAAWAGRRRGLVVAGIVGCSAAGRPRTTRGAARGARRASSRRLRPARRSAWPPGCPVAVRRRGRGQRGAGTARAATAGDRAPLPAGRRTPAGLGRRSPPRSPGWGGSSSGRASPVPAVAPALRALAADCRADGPRRRPRRRVRRAGVWVLAPLGLCFLPAFVCLGVVPLVLGHRGDVFG